jgi:hypothetical protein
MYLGLLGVLGFFFLHCVAKVLLIGYDVSLGANQKVAQLFWF